MEQDNIMQVRQHPVLDFAGEELSSMITRYAAADKLDKKQIIIGTWQDCEEQLTATGNARQWPWSSDAEDENAHTEKASAGNAHAKVYSDDAYVIIEEDDRLILTGKSERSTLYAVYAYAKETWGLLWVYPGQEPVIASQESRSEPTTASRQASVSSKPVIDQPLYTRRGFVYENLKDEPYLLTVVDWLAKNRVNELFMTFMLWDHLGDALLPELEKRGITLTLGGHSMKFFLPQFADQKQLDYTQMEWQEKVIADIVDYCRSIPILSRISLWPEDAAVSADEAAKTPFMPIYIRFTEQLRAALLAAGLEVEVEHIAYNAGLSWDMLELRDGMQSSEQLDTLFAYWGRDYSENWSSDSREEDARAYASLQHWTRESSTRGRALCVFEYYSDHFMLSPLFPSLPVRMRDDLTRFKSLGIDGITNLVVPYPQAGADYSWKWAQGYNSYLFARLTWGDDYEAALSDYWQYAPAEERAFLQSAMDRIGKPLSRITAFNIPLFPARVFDAKQVQKQSPHAKEIVQILTDLQHDLKYVLDYLKLKTDKKIRAFELYFAHLFRVSQELAAEWEKKRIDERA